MALFASLKAKEGMLTSYKPERLYTSVFYCNRASFEDGNGKDS